MKLDLSLYGLLNHILMTGLGFFIALVFSKKKKKSSSENNEPLKSENSAGTKKSSLLKFVKSRIIRVGLAFFYIIIFFIFFRYSKISISQLITLVVSTGLFFLFFKLKKVMGTLFFLMIIAIVVMFVMLNRSLYLLFKEEVVGRIKITSVAPGFITMKIQELDDGEVKKTHEKVRVQGNQIGVFAYQLFYKKWMSFLGVDHKFLWAGALGVNFKLSKQGRAKANLDIYILDPDNYAKNQKIWTRMEQRELFLPGVRTVQRIIVLKSPIKGATYKVIKHRTGQLTLEIKRK